MSAKEHARGHEIPDLNPADLERRSIERAETIPSAWYTESGFCDFDQRAVFECTWQLVGPSSRVVETGARMVGVAGSEPVVVVRGDDGVLRAFHNVCRHRGGPVAVEDGCAAVLQCAYHGWTYGLDGSLRRARGFEGVEDFSVDEIHLPSMHVEEWQGLVFVHVAEPQESLDAVIDNLEDSLAPERLEDLVFHRRVEYRVRANWKVYVDNYLEGLHLPFVHPGLSAMLDGTRYETTLGRLHSLQEGPIRAGGTARYVFGFPNWMLNVLPGRLQTNVVIPDGPRNCRVVFDYYYDDSGDVEARVAEDDEMAHQTQAEDIRICEQVQAGLESSTYDRGRLSVFHETGVHHFQDLLRDAYGRARRSEG